MLEQTDIIEKIYKIITSKSIRQGPLPDIIRKEAILTNIQNTVQNNQPIKVLIGWGACKNLNLPYQNPDMTEVATISFLKFHLDKIKDIYTPGYNIIIQHLDTRMCSMNGFSDDGAREYKGGLKELLLKYRLFDNISIVSDSELLKNHDDWEIKYHQIENRVTVEDVINSEGFSFHIENAKRNNPCDTALAKLISSLRKMVIFKILEIELGLLNHPETQYDIRIFFKKEDPKINIYRDFIKTPYEHGFNISSIIYTFTGSKGNVTQPWQAYSTAQNLDQKILFISQSKMEKDKNSIITST